MTKSEAARHNALKRWAGNQSPTGVPYAQQNREQRLEYKRLTMRLSRERRRLGISIKTLRIAEEADISKAMRLWHG